MANWGVGETIGPKRTMTPEGFLLCHDVPIARIGPMVYRAGELPSIAPGSTGVIVVHRKEEDVFDEQSMASFEGKPVVVEHPTKNGQLVLLTSDNWRQFSVGSTHNVRRGEGTQDNLLLADLLITDSAAISEVMAGKREISCGYVSQYQQMEPGQARQHKIRGNHVALVRQGRCGHSCMIGDTTDMTVQERLAALRASRDAATKKAADDYELAIAGLVTTDNIGMPGPGALTADPSGRIIVNVHGTGKAAGMDAPMPGAAPAAPAPAPAAVPGGAAPAPGGQDIMTQILMELQKLTALLTDGGDGGEEDPNDMGGEEDDDDQFQNSSQSSEGSKPDIGANGESKTNKPPVGDDGDLTKPNVQPKSVNPGKVGAGNGLPGDGTATGDKKPKKAIVTADSTALASKYQDVISRGEILVPGKEAPKFDAKNVDTITLDSLCTFRRAVLADAMKDEKLKPLIASLIGTTDVATADGAMVEGLFMGASELVAASRRASVNSKMMLTTPTHFVTGDKKPGVTPASINAQADKLWGRAAA